MKVYRIDASHRDIGRVVAWAATRAEARAAVQAFIKDGAIPLCEPQIFDVPTKKAELVAWLNWHIQTDNG